MHCKQIDNREQTFWKNKVHWVKQTIIWFKFSLRKVIVPGTVWIVWLIAKGLTIFLLSVVERQRRCHPRFHDLMHMIIKGNIEWCIISLHIFLKSYWAKWPRIQAAFFHGRTVKGAASNIFTCKPCSIMKTLGLIRSNRILSCTNHESVKFQRFQVQTAWQCNSQ